MNIENAKTTFFTDKEHYLNFRKAWASAVNSPRAKSHLEPCHEWLNSRLSEGTGRQRVQGWITREHAILYNLLRELSIDNGFTQVTNKKRLDNSGLRNHGLYFGTYRLQFICQNAEQLINRPFDSDWAKSSVNGFLEPFGETVTKEMLKKLVNYIPQIPYKTKGYTSQEKIL